MSRYFEPISVNELKKKVLACKEDWLDYRRLTKVVEKDLDKVHFDTENITTENDFDDITGYHRLSNGMPYLGIMAGGDWETSVFFCIYWDGKNLRGYIPEEGNLWNTTTKEAYGNDEAADLKNARKRWPDDVNLKDDNFDLYGYLDNYDLKAMQQDMMARITLKTAKPSALAAYTDEELLAELKRRHLPKSKKVVK